MSKKNAKAQKSNELDGVEFSAAISLIEKEKGIPKAYMLGKITQALVSAYKRDHRGAGDNAIVEVDEEVDTVYMFIKKDVVEEVDSPCTEMGFQMAQEKLPHTQLGDVIHIEVCTRDFGRTAAQTVRQMITQGMREAKRGVIYDEFSSEKHEILTGVVTRVDPCPGAVSLRIGSGSEATEAFLTLGEQAKGETYLEGMRLRVCVVETRRSTKGPQVLISCTHPGLVKRLSELEMPEIYDGTVEVKSIACETGSHTKLVVRSADPDAGPIGVCVDPWGQQVNNIVGELKGEKVSITKWSEEPAECIIAALSPVDVVSVAIREEGKACHVVVPDDQLSLAIDKERQNARLAAKLTSWKIDIKPVFTPADEEPEDEVDVLLDDKAETEEQARRGRPPEWGWPSLGLAAGGTALVSHKRSTEDETLVWGSSAAPDGMKTGFPQKGPAFCGAGQNAQLAAKLTGQKVDIKPVSAPFDEEPEDEEGVLLGNGAETEG